MERNKLIVVGAVFLFGLLSVYIFSATIGDGLNDAAKLDSGVVNSPQDTVSVVRIPLAEVSSTVKQYSYDAGGKQVKYLVVLGSDGKPRTAFDACEVCGGRKGYRQRGKDVICNNCGRYFSIDDLGTKNRGGGCWPGYLPHTIDGDEIVIKETDLYGGRKYF